MKKNDPTMFDPCEMFGRLKADASTVGKLLRAMKRLGPHIPAQLETYLLYHEATVSLPSERINGESMLGRLQLMIHNHQLPDILKAFDDANRAIGTSFLAEAAREAEWRLPFVPWNLTDLVRGQETQLGNGLCDDL